jgi:hypothetical protein
VVELRSNPIERHPSAQPDRTVPVNQRIKRRGPGRPSANAAVRSRETSIVVFEAALP